MSPRVIVLCFDGTSNHFCDANTNVVKLYALLDKRRPLEQLVYYQPGIGTYINPGVVSPALTWFAKKADIAVAWYLNEHIMAGYKFLMRNYREGDKICLFGFSRGAYTARALEGFLYKIGLLPRDNEEQVPFAYNLYKRTDIKGKKLAKGFKKTFCTPVTIDFLGVWDTVASVGMVVNRAPPITFSHKEVRIARHALSLDERRARFQPSLFVRNAGGCGDLAPSGPVSESSNQEVGTRKRYSQRFKFEFMKWVRRPALGKGESIPGTNRENLCNANAPNKESGPLAPSLDVNNPLAPVLEVWFPGCHADVGGSAVKDKVPSPLSKTSLRWMVKHIIDSGCPIVFDEEALREVSIDELTQSNTEGSSDSETGTGLVSQRTLPDSPTEDDSGEDIKTETADESGNESSSESDDTVGTHDELKRRPAWWVLEFFPTRLMRQQADGRWRPKWRINYGRGRKITEEPPLFHISVEERKTYGYMPKAKWKGQEIYVDRNAGAHDSIC